MSKTPAVTVHKASPALVEKLNSLHGLNVQTATTWDCGKALEILAKSMLKYPKKSFLKDPVINATAYVEPIRAGKDESGAPKRYQLRIGQIVPQDLSRTNQPDRLLPILLYDRMANPDALHFDKKTCILGGFSLPELAEAINTLAKSTDLIRDGNGIPKASLLEEISAIQTGKGQAI